MPQMEYTDEVIAQIREGKSPNELEQEQTGKSSEESDDKTIETPKPSKYDATARKDGWVSEKEWVEQGKDPDDWVGAAEFVRRGELMNRIKGQSKALKASEKRQKELEERVRVIAEHNAKISQVAYEKAKKELKRARREAIDERDHETVEDIDEKLDELEENAKAAESTKPAKEESSQNEAPPAIVQEWLENPDNAWYNEDLVLQAAADRLAEQYGRMHFDPALDPEDQPWEEMFEAVEAQLRKRFPNEFKTIDQVEEEDEDEDEIVEEKPRKPVSRKTRVAEPGQRSNRKASNKNKLTLNDLNADERKAHDEFVHKQQLMTSEQYLEQLEAVRDL